jgi:hypothetical protein
VHIRAGKADGYEKRALAWIRYAENEGFEALVLVIDEDGYRERQLQLAKAQEDMRLALPRALGVAIRTFDAWILADEVALTQVLRGAIGRQRSPEAIAEPKLVCRQLRESSEAEMSASEFYAAVANVARLDVLESRCPRGFGEFAERVRAL